MKKKSFVHASVILIVAAFTAYLFIPRSSSARQVDKNARKPVAQATKGVSKRAYPKLDYVKYQVSKEYFKIHVQLAPQALRLIQSHPSPEICEDLYSLLQNQQVGLRFFQSPPNTQGHLGKMTVMRVPGRGPMAVMAINATHMMGNRVGTPYKKLVFTHEYVHLLQYQAGEYSDLFRPVPIGQPFSLKEALAYFEMEYEAYVIECRLAVEQGWVSQDPMYLVFKRDGEQAYREYMPMYIADTQPRCRPYLSQLMERAKTPRTIKARPRLTQAQKKTLGAPKSH